jgi:hypothetical protein
MVGEEGGVEAFDDWWLRRGHSEDLLKMDQPHPFELSEHSLEYISNMMDEGLWLYMYLR